MKIYTKMGDKGETGLLGGIRVSKSHLAIQVCGSLDETNSLVGLVRSEPLAESVDEVLIRIQNDLFDLGSRVAACLGESSRPTEFPPGRSTELEGFIDDFQDQVPTLTAFILPSGSRAGCLLHLSRSVCRRTERELVALMKMDLEVDLSVELIYLNRLGDLLFVMARLVNQFNESPEVEWNVGRGISEKKPPKD